VVNGFSKIIKIVATRSYILKIYLTKFDLGWGIAHTPLRNLTTLPPKPQLNFTSPTSKGKKGTKEEKETKKRGEMRKRKWRKREWKTVDSHNSHFWLRHYAYSDYGAIG